MSLEAIYFLSQIIAAICIVASLIFAGLQFRVYAQQSRETRLSAYTSDIQQFRHAIVVDRDVARIYRDGLEDMEKLDALDKWRFGAMMQNLTGNYQLVIEFGDFMTSSAGKEGFDWILKRPGYRQWWLRARQMYSGELRANIDRATQVAEPAKT